MDKTVDDIVKRMHERYKGSTLLPKNRQSTRLIIMEACRLLIEMVKEGDTVYLSDLGAFELRWSRGKKLHHPATGEILEVPDHYKINFTMNKRLRQEIAQLPYIDKNKKEEPEKEVT